MAIGNEKLQVIIRKEQTKQQLATFVHRVLGSPVESTLLKAMRNGHFTSFPAAFNKDLIRKHLPKSIATAQGHMKHEKQGWQSTTKPPQTLQIQLEEISKYGSS